MLTNKPSMLPELSSKYPNCKKNDQNGIEKSEPCENGDMSENKLLVSFQHQDISNLRYVRRIFYEWFLTSERVSIIVCIFMTIGTSVSGLNLPILVGNFIDTITKQEDDEKNVLLILVIVVAIQQIFAAISLVWLSYISEKFTLRLRKRTFKALIRKSQQFFDTTPKQVMLQCVLSDIDSIRTVINTELSLFFERIFTAVGGIICITWISLTLGLYTMIIAPIVALTLSQVGEYVVYPLERKARSTVVECADALDENFDNVHIVRSFGMEDAVSDRFNTPAEKRYYADWRSASGIILFKGVIWLVAGMLLLFACGYGRTMVRDSNSSIRTGDLVAFLAYALQIALALANSAHGMTIINTGLSCAKNTMAIMDKNTECNSNEWDVCTNSMLKVDEVRFENVTFSYPTAGRDNVRVLKDLSLCLRRGKSTALVGPSGAGKSSVMALIEKFYLPSTGIIWVDGVINLNSINTKLWRSKIGLVTQDACLFQGTIYENIALGKPDSVMVAMEIENAARLANVTEFSDAFPLGLQQQVGHKGCHLSSGQRQRVAVARAILRDPSILLLDEHTSQLDTQSERFVQDSLDGIMKDRITLIIAHRLQTARRANEICVLNTGKIVEIGTHDTLLNKENGAYKALWLAQQMKINNG